MSPVTRAGVGGPDCDRWPGKGRAYFVYLDNPRGRIECESVVEQTCLKPIALWWLAHYC